MSYVWKVVPLDSTDDTLIHYGIKGQRWGRRRFQYANGKLTPAGVRRYQKDDDDKESKEYQEEKEYNSQKNTDGLGVYKPVTGESLSRQVDYGNASDEYLKEIGAIPTETNTSNEKQTNYTNASDEYLKEIGAIPAERSSSTKPVNSSSGSKEYREEKSANSTSNQYPSSTALVPVEKQDTRLEAALRATMEAASKYIEKGKEIVSKLAKTIGNQSVDAIDSAVQKGKAIFERILKRKGN